MTLNDIKKVKVQIHRELYGFPSNKNIKEFISRWTAYLLINYSITRDEAISLVMMVINEIMGIKSKKR